MVDRDACHTKQCDLCQSNANIPQFVLQEHPQWVQPEPGRRVGHFNEPDKKVRIVIQRDVSLYINEEDRVN